MIIHSLRAADRGRSSLESELSRPVDVADFRLQLRSGKHTLHQLRMKVQSLPAKDRFDALLGLFTENCGTDTYTHQEIAGRLLLDLMPDCPYPLGSALAAIAPTWNVSVEQLPFYLADRFRREIVSAAAESLARSFPSDARESRALDTIAWWLRGRDQGRTNNTMHPSGGSGVS